MACNISVTPPSLNAVAVTDIQATINTVAMAAATIHTSFPKQLLIGKLHS